MKSTRVSMQCNVIAMNLPFNSYEFARKLTFK